MRYRFTPHSWPTLLVVAAGFAVIAAGLSWSLFTSWAAFDMRDVIVQARNHAQIVLFLPAGWLGVWAARVHAKNSVIVGPAPGRARRRIVAGQVVPLAGAAGLGWLLGWAPACVVALAGQYWVPVDLVAMVTLAVGVASVVALGFVVAALFGVRAGAFAAPLAVLAVMVLPGFTVNDWLDGHASTVALSYVWPAEMPGNGTQLLVGPELVRLVFFLLVGVAATMAASGLAEFRSTRRTRALRAAGWLAFPLAVAVVVALIRPVLWADDPADQPRCQADALGVTLCLYQIDEPQRDQFTQAIDPLVALMPSGMAGTIRISEDQWNPDGIGISPETGTRTAWLTNMLGSLAINLFIPFTDSCTDGNANTVDQTQDALQMSILAQVGTRAAAATTHDPVLSHAYATLADGYGPTSPEADQRLDTLTDAQFTAWYAHILAKAAACHLAESDLP